MPGGSAGGADAAAADRAATDAVAPPTDALENVSGRTDAGIRTQKYSEGGPNMMQTVKIWFISTIVLWCLTRFP